MTTFSIIVPTRNRGRLLSDAVGSIAPQARVAGAELLIVDSASTDDTPEVIAGLRRDNPGLRTVRSSDPGLLAARHLGAKESRGEVMVFVDDDVVVSPGWFQAYQDGFSDPSVSLAGGPSRPRWERQPPWWIDIFSSPVDNGWALPSLSLIDCGPKVVDISPEWVYGCNFAVRRKDFLQYGGFHPDSVPRELTAWRGDGETALAAAIARGTGKVRHFPGAALEHVIPASRMTEAYFLWRAFCQGVSDSYTSLRRENGLAPPAPAADNPPHRSSRLLRLFKGLIQLGPVRWFIRRRLLHTVEEARNKGRRWHRRASRDPAVLAWILRRDYFDGQAIPSLPVPTPPERP